MHFAVSCEANDDNSNLDRFFLVSGTAQLFREAQGDQHANIGRDSTFSKTKTETLMHTLDSVDDWFCSQVGGLPAEAGASLREQKERGADKGGRTLPGGCVGL